MKTDIVIPKGWRRLRKDELIRIGDKLHFNGRFETVHDSAGKKQDLFPDLRPFIRRIINPKKSRVVYTLTTLGALLKYPHRGSKKCRLWYKEVPRHWSQPIHLPRHYSERTISAKKAREMFPEAFKK